MNNTAIIILAAGNSSRFGKMKQLLHHNSTTLLQHVVDEAVGADARPVILVTGYHANEIAGNMNLHDQVQVVVNEQWKKGMASGIAAGVEAVVDDNKIDKIIIAVCDQPFISSAVFNRLYKTQEETGKQIVASAYADTLGTPVLFTRKYFGALKGLQGDEGAKKIVRSNEDDVATIEFPEGAIDIDSEDDYKNLLDRQKHVL